MDAHCVYLTTDADGNDAVNAFYRNAGFQCTRRFMQPGGRWMNEYVINGREPSDGCEPQLESGASHADATDILQTF